jgi:adenylate kinase
MKVYREQTEPLKAYYDAKGKLVSVDGCHRVEDTTKVVLKALEERNVEASV